MKYTEKILKHPEFLRVMKQVKELENNRIYCHHELEHALDVARMAWIAYLEDGMSDKKGDVLQKKDLIYACALLHDIGRAAQYETGVHHAVSGLSLAGQIMDDCHVPLAWKQEILDVISEHHQSFSDEKNERKNSLNTGEKCLEYYIRKADHDCRLCFFCEAKDTCKWEIAERNQSVVS